MTISISRAHGSTESGTVAIADRTILPGERVGAVTRTTTRQALSALFGEAALEDEIITLGEGETELGTVVNPDADASFTIIWANPERTEVASVLEVGTDWSTPEGIRVGMSLAELAMLLGEFQFYGFDWDYGGCVMLENTKLAGYAGKLILQIEPSEASRARSPKAIDALSGDSLFKSSSPHLAQLEVAVETVTVLL